MSLKWKVWIALLAGVLIFVGVDLYAALTEDGATASEQVMDWRWKLPVIIPALVGYIFGFLSGHLLWPQKRKKVGQ